MQQVNNATASLLARYAKISLTAYLDGSKISAGIANCAVSYAAGDDQALTFGNACASSVSLTVSAPMPDVKKKALSIMWSVDGVEYPLFSGKINNANVRAGQTDLEAWDAMFWGGSDAFVPTDAMFSDIPAADAFRLIGTAMGASVSDEAVEMLKDVTIFNGFADIPDDTSNAAAAGYIAGLIGGNAIIDRSGKLTIRGIQPVDFSTQPYAGRANAKGTDFEVTGITFQRSMMLGVLHPDGSTSEEEIIAEYYAGDGSLMLSNPLADQVAADRAYEVLKDISIRPGDYSFPGGLLLEPGDVICVESMDGNYNVAAVMISMTFDGGVQTTVACGGAPDTGGAQGAINQALATLEADFARIRKLVAENAEIVSAKITNLSVDDIVVGRIRSTDFHAETLPLVYPVSIYDSVNPLVYPSAQIYPSNGEQIIRGLEIDFTSGTIRGVFWNESFDALERRVKALEENQASILERISALESGR